MISVDAIPLFHLAAGHTDAIGQQTKSRDNSEIHGFLFFWAKKCLYMSDNRSNFFSTDPSPSRQGNGGSASIKLTIAEDEKLFIMPRWTLWKKSDLKKSIALASSSPKPSRIDGFSSHGSSRKIVGAHTGVWETSSKGKAARWFLSSRSCPAKHL